MSGASAVEKHRALESLFEEWRRARPDPDWMAKDGIIAPATFDDRLRILFVLKETSSPDFGAYDHDLRAWITAEAGGSTWINLARWAAALLGSGSAPPGQSEQQWARAVLGRVAVLNLNKFSASTVADMVRINAYAARDAEFIRREIDIIDPHVIVGCGVREPLIWLLSLGSAYLRAEVDGQTGVVTDLWDGRRLVLLTRHPNRASKDGAGPHLRAAWDRHRSQA